MRRELAMLKVWFITPSGSLYETNTHSDATPQANEYIKWLQKHNSPLKTLFLSEKDFKTGNNVHMLSGTHELQCFKNVSNSSRQDVLLHLCCFPE